MKKINLTVQDLETVKVAAVILSENLDKHITIPQLAQEVRLTDKKLKAGFKRQFGKGIYRYHLDCKMEKAKQMLLSNEPLKAIAAATGYQDEQALITTFRREFQVTPAQWRRNEQQAHG